MTHVGEYLRVLIQYLVKKANRLLSRQNALIVDPADHGSEQRGSRTGASAHCYFHPVGKCDVCTQQGDVGKGAPGLVVCSLGVLGVVRVEVLGNGFLLVRRLTIEVAEAS